MPRGVQPRCAVPCHAVLTSILGCCVADSYEIPCQACVEKQHLLAALLSGLRLPVVQAEGTGRLEVLQHPLPLLPTSPAAGHSEQVGAPSDRRNTCCSGTFWRTSDSLVSCVSCMVSDAQPLHNEAQRQGHSLC